MREIDQVINYWRANELAGKSTALASVVFVEGSSYRRPGARMLVTSTARRWADRKDSAVVLDLFSFRQNLTHKKQDLI